MDIQELRVELGNITRETITGPWEEFIDYDGMRKQIDENSKKTSAWVETGKK